MRKMSGHDLLILFLGFSLLAGLAYAYLGGTGGTPFSFGQFQAHDCTAKIQLLSQDYGPAQASQRVFFEGQDIQPITFGNSFPVQFEGNNCRMVEDPSKTKGYFRATSVHLKLQSIPDDFFVKTRQCINFAVPEGASRVCDAVTTFRGASESLPATIVASVPTESSQKFAQEVSGKGWTRYVVGSGVEFIKRVGATDVAAAISFTEASSCTLKNTPKKTVWDLSDQGNVVFRKAKAGEFYSDTVAKLTAIPELIITMESVNVNRAFPEFQLKQDPNLLDVAGSLVGFVTSAVGYAHAAAVEFSTETISALSTPECGASQQISKFQDFSQKINLAEADSAAARSLNLLENYRGGASEAISQEMRAKELNWPDLPKWALVPSKSFAYAFSFSKSNDLFQEQRYVSSRNQALGAVPSYSDTWKNIEFEHVLFSIVLWGGFAFLIRQKWDEKREKNHEQGQIENSGPGEGPA